MPCMENGRWGLPSSYLELAALGSPAMWYLARTSTCRCHWYVALSTHSEVANFILLILLACIYYLASQAPWPDPPGSIVSMLMHGIGLGYIGSLLDGAGPAMAGLASHRTIVFCYITLVETFPIVQRGCHAALFSPTTSSSSSPLINITSSDCLDSVMLESDS